MSYADMNFVDYATRVINQRSAEGDQQPVRFYLASAYSRRAEIREMAEIICSLTMWQCTSSWLTAQHEPDPDETFYGSFAARLNSDPLSPQRKEMRKSAERDALDVQLADFVIVCTAMNASCTGGHHWETGFMCALGKPFYVVGPNVNIFHTLAAEKFDSPLAFVRMLIDRWDPINLSFDELRGEDDMSNSRRLENVWQRGTQGQWEPPYVGTPTVFPMPTTTPPSGKHRKCSLPNCETHKSNPTADFTACAEPGKGQPPEGSDWVSEGDCSTCGRGGCPDCTDRVD